MLAFRLDKQFASGPGLADGPVLPNVAVRVGHPSMPEAGRGEPTLAVASRWCSLVGHLHGANLGTLGFSANLPELYGPNEYLETLYVTAAGDLHLYPRSGSVTVVQWLQTEKSTWGTPGGISGAEYYALSDLQLHWMVCWSLAPGYPAGAGYTALRCSVVACDAAWQQIDRADHDFRLCCPVANVATLSTFGEVGTLDTRLPHQWSGSELRLRLPWDGNLLATGAGVQLLARRDTETPEQSTIWRRRSLSEAWQVAGRIGAHAVHLTQLREEVRAMSPIYLGGYGPVSSGGVDWADWDGVWVGNELSCYNDGDPATLLTDLCYDPRLGVLEGCGLRYTGDAEELVFGSALLERDARLARTVTVDEHLRGTSDDGPEPRPFLLRDPADGRRRIGCLVGLVYREWSSLDLVGREWAAPVQSDLVNGVALTAPAVWCAPDGRLVAAGYADEDQQIVVLMRQSPTSPWRGRYLNAAVANFAAPYLWQRPGGDWECGWLLDGTWTRYLAADPAGTWSPA